MAEDLMRYDQMAQNALRGVVRDALRRVVASGLPGDHHFYIAFNTRYPGVSISEKLLGRYPREMTIVLQHQYSDLIITEEQFQVVLFFDQTPEKLVVPFQAVKGFLDPAVQFGLQFEVVQLDSKSLPKEEATIETFSTEARSGTELREAHAPTDPDAAPSEPKVISLDAFRKK
jgi:hypothetical protein